MSQSNQLAAFPSIELSVAFQLCDEEFIDEELTTDLLSVATIKINVEKLQAMIGMRDAAQILGASVSLLNSNASVTTRNPSFRMAHIAQSEVHLSAAGALSVFCTDTESDTVHTSTNSVSLDQVEAALLRLSTANPKGTLFVAHDGPAYLLAHDKNSDIHKAFVDCFRNNPGEAYADELAFVLQELHDVDDIQMVATEI